MLFHKPFILFLLAFFCNRSIAQSDDVLIKKLLADIASAQVNGSDPNFYEGTFPSFRECAGVPHNYQPDYNIFYTGVTAFSLRNMLPHLDGENRSIAERVIEKAKASYTHYQNKNGLPFYNFWPAGKEVLPHSFIWHHLSNAFNRGDDADDTVLMLMSMDANDSTSSLVKKRMIAVSNTEKKRINTSYKKYRDIAAYSTYLGLNSSPDFDFAVQCNLIYFMYDRKLPFTKQDSATIDVLQQMIRDRRYLRSPVFISPYYVTTPILLYHLARLMGKFQIPALEIYRQQIIDDIKDEIEHSENVMNQVILNTALLRLGEKGYYLQVNEKDIEIIRKMKFPFCQARAAYNFPSALKHIFLHWKYMIYYFYCPAYNETLLLEYLVERNKK